MASPERSSSGRVPIQPILAVNFVGTLGFSVVLPFLVFLVTRWGGNAFVYGVMGATYSAFQLVGAPLLGRWSDRLGRRRVLLWSQLGTLVSWVIFAIAFALPEHPLLRVDSAALGSFTLTAPLIAMFLARAFDGLTGGNVSVANAYLADITTEEQRAVSFGRMAVAANLGFILGPAVAGLVSGTPLGELAPVLAALGISVVATLLILLRLPEATPCRLAADPEPHNVRKVFGQEPRRCFRLEGAERLTLRGLLALGDVPLLLAAHFLVMLGFNFYYVAFPVYAATSLEWSVRQTGVYFAAMSALMALVQGPVLARAARRWGERTLVAIGSLTLAASFVCFGSSHPAWISLGVVLLALGNGLMWPSLVSLLTLAAGQRFQGAVQGLAGSAGALASILGLLVGGALYTRLEARVFLLSSVMILAVFLCTLWLGRRRPPRDLGVAEAAASA